MERPPSSIYGHSNIHWFQDKLEALCGIVSSLSTGPPQMPHPMVGGMVPLDPALAYMSGYGHAPRPPPPQVNLVGYNSLLKSLIRVIPQIWPGGESISRKKDSLCSVRQPAKQIGKVNTRDGFRFCTL
jgi:hypothetical protein